MKNNNFVKSCIAFMLVFFLSGQAMTEDSLKFDLFNFKETPLADPITLWATSYYLPELEDGTGEIVLYIPEANGAKIKLNHVDVFIGTHNNSFFFPWISHVSTFAFQAYIVKDEVIITN